MYSVNGVAMQPIHFAVMEDAVEAVELLLNLDSELVGQYLIL